MRSYKISILVSNDIATDQRMHRICKSLCNVGFQVEITGRNLLTSYALASQKYKQTRHNMFFVQGPLFYLELNIRHFFYLLNSKPEIVYAVDADTSLAALVYKRIFNKKVIFDSHELFSEVPELKERFLIKRIWKYIEKMIIKNADLCITVSDSIAHYFEELYKKKFYTIKNFPIKKEQIEFTSNDRYILYQGALNKGRCIEQLLRISAKTGIKIKIVGEGDLSHELRKQAANLSLNVNEIFLGKIKPDELHRYTTKAWLGYNMLENCSLSYYYSLSNKTFDYIQAGIPQIMPDFPEYLALNDTYKIGITISPDEEKILEIIEKLYKDDIRYNELKSGAVNAASILTWENEEVNFINIIKNLFENA